MTILTPRATYAPMLYPKAHQYWELQQSVHWLPNEIPMGQDVNDFKMNLTDSDKNVLAQILKAFTTTEIFVEDYWTNIVANRFKQPEIQRMATCFAGMECFDGETEIATTLGWKNIKDVTSTDLVGQYDINTKIISFTNPLKLHKYNYVGDMVHYVGQCTDLMVTPNHELITINPHTKKITKRQASENKLTSNFFYPCSSSTSYRYTTLSDLERLYIAIQADGTVFRSTPIGKIRERNDISFHLAKQHKKERLILLLNNLKIDFVETTKENNASVFRFNLPETTSFEILKSLNWIDITKISALKAEEIIDECLHWDATIRHTKKGLVGEYFNTNKEAVDKLSLVAVISNKYCAKLGVNKTEEQSLSTSLPNSSNPANAKICYKLGITKRIEKCYPKKLLVPYSGFVYCLSVPTENLIVRRNGHVSFTGNSIHQVAYARINEELGLDDFESFLSEPTSKEKIDNIINVKSKTKEDLALSLAVFSAFTEGVNLFSSFAILMSFQKRNLMKGVGKIVEWSVRDEQMHSEAGCWLFKEFIKEFPEILSEDFKKKVYDAARTSVELEDHFLEKVFEMGDIKGITKLQVKNYIRYRANSKLKELGLGAIWKNIDQEQLNELSWFDVIATGVVSQDFFSARESSYYKGLNFNNIWS